MVPTETVIHPRVIVDDSSDVLAQRGAGVGGTTTVATVAGPGRYGPPGIEERGVSAAEKVFENHLPADSRSETMGRRKITWCPRVLSQSSGGGTRLAGGSRTRPPGAYVRVGIDIVAVDDVVDSIARLGDRYLRRVYTEHEQSCCEGDAVRAAALAARFAAKEATVKVLRPVGARPEWRSIEVCRGRGGACDIRLSGQAAHMASEQGIEHLAVSLTHEGPWAAAVVTAVCADRPGVAGNGRVREEVKEDG
ncbi:MAG: holo-ACP synthase [Acidimicrobiales bacterium]